MFLKVAEENVLLILIELMDLVWETRILSNSLVTIRTCLFSLKLSAQANKPALACLI